MQLYLKPLTAHSFQNITCTTVDRRMRERQQTHAKLGQTKVTMCFVEHPVTCPLEKKVEHLKEDYVHQYLVYFFSHQFEF